MCTNTSYKIKDYELFNFLLVKFLEVQNNGILKNYFEKAKEVCIEMEISICDMYKYWQKLIDNGVNTIELLANRLNNPIREFHYYIAIKII